MSFQICPLLSVVSLIKFREVVQSLLNMYIEGFDPQQTILNVRYNMENFMVIVLTNECYIDERTKF